MMRIQLIQIGEIILAVIVLGVIVDWMNVLLAKWRVKRLIARYQAGTLQIKSLENPKNGIIVITKDGFYTVIGKSKSNITQWADVREITAFKRDLIAVDLVCILVETEEGTQRRVIEMNEEMLGFLTFMKTIEQVYPIRDQHWWTKVAFPAFKTNPTVLWAVGDNSTALGATHESTSVQ